jgi:small-conductance mechanosensitive channel
LNTKEIGSDLKLSLLNILNKKLYGDITVIHLLIAFFILILTFLFTKFVALQMKKRFKGKIEDFKLDLITKGINGFIYAVSIIWVLNILGVNITSLFVAGGIIGVVLGFATQRVGSNLVSGLFLMIERPFKIGHTVLIDGNSGVVQDINAFSTVIRNFEGNFVRIPNEKVFTSTITSINVNPARRVEYTVGIRYKDDADKAISIVKSILEENPFCLVKPEAKIFVEQLADSSVNIKILFWVPSSKWFDVRSKLLWKIKMALEENGIQIPFPQRELWFNNELSFKSLNSNQS